MLRRWTIVYLNDFIPYARQGKNTGMTCQNSTVNSRKTFPRNVSVDYLIIFQIKMQSRPGNRAPVLGRGLCELPRSLIPRTLHYATVL